MRPLCLAFLLLCGLAASARAEQACFTIPGDVNTPGTIAYELVEAVAQSQFGQMPPALQQCRHHPTNVPGTGLDDRVHCVIATDANGVPTTTIHKGRYFKEVTAQLWRNMYRAYKQKLAADAAGEAAGSEADTASGGIVVE